MKYSVILFLAAIITISIADNVWQFCPGNVNPTFEIQTLNLSPNPPKAGQPANVELVGTLNSEVTAGNSQFNVQYYVAGGWRSLPTFTADACSIISCPVQPGPFSYNTSINVPIFTPHGNYRGTFQMTDQDGRNITCLTFATTIN
eukprot:gene4301-5382_t